MPKRLEEALKRRAVQLGMKPKTDRYNRYVYGTIEKYQGAKSEQRIQSDSGRDASGDR